MLQTEKENLLAQVKDYYRRRNLRNAKGIASATAGGLINMQGGDGLGFMESVMTPATQPATLSPQERFEAKKAMLDSLTEYKKAANSPVKDFMETMKARSAANDKVLDTIAKIYGDKVGGIAQVRSAYNSARVAAAGQASAFLSDRIKEQMLGSGGAALKNITDVNDQIDAALIPKSGGQFPKGATQKIRAAIQGATTVQEKSAIMAAISIQTVANGSDPDAFLNMLDEASLKGDGDASVIFSEWTTHKAGISTIMAGAMATSKDILADTTKALAASLGSGADFEQLTTLGRQLQEFAGGTPEQQTKAMSDMVEAVGKMGEMDPATSEKFANALDALDEDSSSYDPTLAQVRDDLFQQPAFQEYMRNTGITDPKVALRQLRSEARKSWRASYQQSQEKRAERQAQINSGAPDKLVGDKAAVAGEGAGQARSENIGAAALSQNPANAKSRVGNAVDRMSQAAKSAVGATAASPSMVKAGQVVGLARGLGGMVMQGTSGTNAARKAALNHNKILAEAAARRAAKEAAEKAAKEAAEKAAK